MEALCRDRGYFDNNDKQGDMAINMNGNGRGKQSSTAPIKRKPGRPPIDNPRQAVSLRLEPDVLEKFRATGPGWQRRMNDVLKAAKLD